MTTTLLEYVCNRLLGPPTTRQGKGEATWPCPQCGHARWHTRPHKAGEKDRFSCWRCAWWGDALDLLRFFYPRDTYPERVNRLHLLQEDYRRDGGNGPAPVPVGYARHPVAPHVSSSSSFRGGEPGREGRTDNALAVEQAFATLTPDDLMTLADSVAIARRAGVDLEALAYYCWHSVRRIEQSNARHMAECDDPECDWDCCLVARGLPTPTPEQVAADREARKVRRQEDWEEWRRFIKSHPAHPQHHARNGATNDERKKRR